MSASTLGNIPFVPPVSLKAIRDLMMPNTSTVSRVCTFPVLASGRNNSKIFPLETTISCILVPTKTQTFFFSIQFINRKDELYNFILKYTLAIEIITIIRIFHLYLLPLNRNKTAVFIPSKHLNFSHPQITVTI